MKIDGASLRQCTDPALRTIIQYISLKWGAITPCDGKTWDECRTTFDGHDIVWFNDEHGSTRIYEITHIGPSQYTEWLPAEIETDILTLQQLVREMAGLLRKMRKAMHEENTLLGVALFDYAGQADALLASLPEGYGDV